MAEAMRQGLHGTPWSPGPGTHVDRAAAFMLFTEAEPGILCPISMNCAVTPALRRNAAIQRDWGPGLASTQYDERFNPFAQKRGLTMGMGWRWQAKPPPRWRCAWPGRWMAPSTAPTRPAMKS